MADLLQLSVSGFVAATAAKEPTPGGGAVGALTGALSAALATMAVRYTVGKKSFAAHEAELQAAATEFQTAAALFEELVAEDVAAYEALAEFLKLPTEKRAADGEFAAVVVAAIRSPQTAAGIALAVLERCAGLLGKTSKHLVSDLGIAAVLAHATVHASELNVRVNLPLLENQLEAAGLRELVAELSRKADEVYAEVRREMGKRV